MWLHWHWSFENIRMRLYTTWPFYHHSSRWKAFPVVREEANSKNTKHIHYPSFSHVSINVRRRRNFWCPGDAPHRVPGWGPQQLQWGIRLSSGVTCGGGGKGFRIHQEDIRRRTWSHPVRVCTVKACGPDLIPFRSFGKVTIVFI